MKNCFMLTCKGADTQRVQTNPHALLHRACESQESFIEMLVIKHRLTRDTGWSSQAQDGSCPWKLGWRPLQQL